MGKKKDHYGILGVPKAATDGDIKEAYHKQSALKWKAAERGLERLTTAHKEELVGKPPARRGGARGEGAASASSRGSTGVELGRDVRAGRKGAALGREVAGTGGRKSTDQTGGGAKREGLGSSTWKAGGGNCKCPRGPADSFSCAAGAGLGGATGERPSTTFCPTEHLRHRHSTIKTAVKYVNEYYDEEEICPYEDDGEPFCPTDHSTFKMAVKYMNEYYDEEENRSSLDSEPFFPTDHSTFKTAVKYMNEYYDEEENCSSSDSEPFCPTDHSTFKMAVKIMNEYYDEDENLWLSMDADGDDEGGTRDAKDDGGGGADDNYIDHSGADNDDAGFGDDVFNDDDYYAGSFEDDDYYSGGFDDGADSVDGADDLW